MVSVDEGSQRATVLPLYPRTSSVIFSFDTTPYLLSYSVLPPCIAPLASPLLAIMSKMLQALSLPLLILTASKNKTSDNAWRFLYCRPQSHSPT